ncbi:MAG TPA: response regulator [Thermoanaerobaculia bacterium]|nr:response regulator [Thermoanaerobaculia bacterium]
MSKILVVDDEPTVVAGIQAVLELHSIESEGAWECESAEERMASEFFPVILADLRMRSEDDGFRLLDAVRRISPNSRVATMTGYADEATIARLRERGAHLVLRKPFVEDELMAALQEMLAAVEAAAEADADVATLYETTLNTLQAISRGRYGFPAEDVEELVQETWLLFLEKRASVRTPRAWLSGTMANLCRQEIERRMRGRAQSAELPEPSITPVDDDVLTVHQALARLDDRSRTLCTMIGLEQRSYEEVSAATNVPLGSVGPLYLRAKARLRVAMSN